MPGARLMPDVGLSHLALTVREPEVSAAFYRSFAAMEIVHRRASDDGRGDILWISDRTRPFVIVLLPERVVEYRLAGSSHLGVGCASRAEVDERLARARAEHRPVMGPVDAGPPVGYFGIIEDPDGHQLELAYGQEVGLTVRSS